MKWDNREPCASCPYRRDVPVETWHRSEFENLLANDGDEMRGGVFGCHKWRHRPLQERRLCVGWWLDQYERGTPSIQLRLLLIRGGEEARDFCREAGDGGHDLYSSIEEMCEANGAMTARRKQEEDDWEDE